MSRDGSGPPRKITHRFDRFFATNPIELRRVNEKRCKWRVDTDPFALEPGQDSFYSPANVHVHPVQRNSRWNGKNEIRRGFSYIRIFVYRGKLYASIKREGGKLSARPMIDSSHSLASKKKKRDIYFFFSLLHLLLLIPTYLRAKYIFRFHRVTIVGKLVIFRFVPVSTSFEMCWLMKKHQTSLICHPRRVKKRRKKKRKVGKGKWSFRGAWNPADKHSHRRNVFFQGERVEKKKERKEKRKACRPISLREPIVNLP